MISLYTSKWRKSLAWEAVPGWERGCALWGLADSQQPAARGTASPAVQAAHCCSPFPPAQTPSVQWPSPWGCSWWWLLLSLPRFLGEKILTMIPPHIDHHSPLQNKLKNSLSPSSSKSLTWKIRWVSSMEGDGRPVWACLYLPLDGDRVPALGGLWWFFWGSLDLSSKK